jgi:RimJ/RimL family protein N-acetyltransferase
MIADLYTDRLILRMFAESDLDAYAAMCADAEVMRYLGDGQPMSRADSWRSMALVIGHWQLRGYGLWAVEERQGGELIGRIGCWNPDGWPGFEVGWVLRRQSWGQGFAMEAAQASMRFAFEQLNQPHVISLIRPGNERSIRVAERLGEKLEGRTDVKGHEALIYGISRADWTRDRRTTT